MAHAILGDVLCCKRQFETAISEFERAIALNPNFSHLHFAMVLIYAGEHARAIEFVEGHMRIDPFYTPLAPLWRVVAGDPPIPVANFTTSVVSAVPGLFTISRGVGPIAAANEDGSYNSASNPALRNNATVRMGSSSRSSALKLRRRKPSMSAMASTTRPP